MTNKNVSREIFEEYIQIVLKWNNKINLISKNISYDDIWDRHVYDSMSLINFIDSNDKVIDVGSGAGFPGIILSLMGVKDVILIESDSRKAAFLLQASKLSNNKITILNKRVENVEIECDVLTSRACASIDDLLNLCKGIKVQKKCLFLKGKKAIVEIDIASKKWDFEYQIHDKEEGCIVELNYDNVDCKPKRRRR